VGYAYNPYKPPVCLAALSLCLFLLGSCASYQANPKLEKTENLYDMMRKTLSHKERSDELFLVLTFSGGGTRAAAMSYGILEALEKIEVTPQHKQSANGNAGHTLLDEVDVISSVSGGSFTAAYYGLHGKEAFEDYPEKFLYQKVQSALLWRVFNPFLWPKLLSAGYNRSEMAADYYDKILFDKKTIRDIFTHQGPIILIQATDIIDGYTFSFTPYFFHLLCSSLNNFRISRAVAASSAFPGAFSGISLTNYAGQCGYTPDPWIYQAVQSNDPMDSLYLFAKRELLYTNSEDKKYIHLYDGGVSDNLGLKGPFAALAQLSERNIDPEKVGLSRTRRVVFIIVNAQTSKTKDRKILNIIPEPPSTRKTLDSAITTIMNSSNFETLYIFENYLEKRLIQKEIAGADSSLINYDIIHINFADIQDAREREFFENLPTTLQLPRETVDQVRTKAGELLYQSDQFRKLVSDLGGRIHSE